MVKILTRHTLALLKKDIIKPHLILQKRLHHENGIKLSKPPCPVREIISPKSTVINHSSISAAVPDYCHK